MNTVISILLWIGAITPGSYSCKEFMSIENNFKPVIEYVSAIQPLRKFIEENEDPSIVVVVPLTEGD